MSVYDIVTDKIIEKLEEGVVPWRRPWTSAGLPVSWQRQREYRGINTLLLEPGEYATFKQIQEAGGRVKKGEKGQIVVFWKMLESKEEEEEANGEARKIPYLRYYKVFNIETQCEGLESRRPKAETYEHDPIAAAENIVKAYASKPHIQHAPGQAYYKPGLDMVSVPALTDYKQAEEYYSTLYHELVHSTGHITRLARPGIMETAKFGSETYSKEELVAELGAAMLCGVARIDNSTLDNSASYIQSWLRVLKEDSKLIVYAAAQAQKAADYIRGIAYKEEASA